jgi:hypothetical protein
VLFIGLIDIIDDAVERMVESYGWICAGALCIGLWGGFCAGIIDLDHIPAYILGIPLPFAPFDIFHFGVGRALHSVNGIISCGLVALTGGLFLFGVLRLSFVKED